LPGVDVSALLAPYYARVEELNAEIKAKFPQCGITTQRLTHVHGLKKKEAASYTSLAMYLAGSNLAPAAVSYATEGGAFGEQDFPTVICGPGSIDQAHGPDEYISRAQMEKGAGMMSRVAEVLCHERWESAAVIS
jgi:acetylornithine deacetylase